MSDGAAPPHAGFDPQMRIDWIDARCAASRPPPAGWASPSCRASAAPPFAIRGTPIGATRPMTWPRCAAWAWSRLILLVEDRELEALGRPGHRGARVASGRRGAASSDGRWLAAGVGGGDGSDPGRGRRGADHRRRGRRLHGWRGSHGDGGRLRAGASGQLRPSRRSTRCARCVTRPRWRRRRRSGSSGATPRAAVARQQEPSRRP